MLLPATAAGAELAVDVAPEAGCRHDDDREAIRAGVDDGVVRDHPVVGNDNAGLNPDVVTDADVLTDVDIVADLAAPAKPAVRADHDPISDPAVVVDGAAATDRHLRAHFEGMQSYVVAERAVLADLHRRTLDPEVLADDGARGNGDRSAPRRVDLLGVQLGRIICTQLGQFDHSPLSHV